jgi:transcription initiation factor TFIIF subunit beta
MDLNQLRNHLFQKFSEKPYWGIPALNAHLKQPDTYLREVLKEIAEQVKEGRYLNMWTLKESYRIGGGIKSGNGNGNDNEAREDKDGDRDEDIKLDPELKDVVFDDADLEGLGVDDGEDDDRDDDDDDDDDEEFDEVEM